MCVCQKVWKEIHQKAIKSELDSFRLFCFYSLSFFIFTELCVCIALIILCKYIVLKLKLYIWRDGLERIKARGCPWHQLWSQGEELQYKSVDFGGALPLTTWMTLHIISLNLFSKVAIRKPSSKNYLDRWPRAKHVLQCLILYMLNSHFPFPAYRVAGGRMREIPFSIFKECAQRKANLISLEYEPGWKLGTWMWNYICALLERQEY